MINVAIIGASGYTGVELVRLLCDHPGVKLTLVTSRQYEGKALAEVFPSLRHKTAMSYENVAIEEVTERAELIFTAVPHKTAMNLVPGILAAGRRVIDLSADFRLRDVAVYEEWYQPHACADFLQEAIYGLPELYRPHIGSARLIANPGCYPTSIILGLAPLLRAGVIQPQTIIADSKSGTSGAGRAAQTSTLFCEVADGFRPYKVGGTHRHTPEIEQELSVLANSPVTISFTPHLLPISRGILSTVYASLQPGCEAATIRKLYREMYANEPFIRILPDGTYPATQYVRGANFCDIAFTIDSRTGRIIIMSAIDNIVKGAAGQAIQNMNIMCGFPETTGISAAPFFP